MPVFVVQLSHPFGLRAGLPAVLCWSDALGVSCQCLDFTPRAPLSLSGTQAGSQTGTAALTQAHISLTNPQPNVFTRSKLIHSSQSFSTHNANSHLGPI